MSKRLFSYPNEANDEADGVKKLLEENHIPYFESPGNRWGFSKAAIWIKNREDFATAKNLFEHYQLDYAQKAREKYQLETGYQPDAPLSHRIGFALGRLLANKKLLLLLAVGFGLVYLYFQLFFSLFTPRN